MKYSKDEDKLLLISYGSFFGGAVDIEFIKENESSCKCKISGGNGYPVDSEFMLSMDELKRLDPVIKKFADGMMIIRIQMIYWMASTGK